ncbi:MAG: FHA domain-containing protein [Deltaproteobacteria bacterium]|nr:FHA domain-containing protein [Deltaproteobacteria bacterium]
MKLSIVDSSGREKEVEIGSEPKLFGRGEDSDFVLGSRSVSRHHMKIWVEDGRVMVEDLSEGGGIEIDGEAMDGVFELEAGAELEAGIFAISIFGSVSDSLSDEFGMEEEIPVPLLVGLKGPTAGLEIELREGDNDVGRDASQYLVIDDASISRQHARLKVENDHFMLFDMRSSNGTFVNRKRIDTCEIKSGDILRFGNLVFRFEYGVIDSGIAKAKKRKKMILMGVAGVVGLALLIGGFKACGAKPVGPTGPAIADPTRGSNIAVDVQVEQFLSVARRNMDQFEWKAARESVNSAIDVFPICKECRILRKQIEEEIAVKNQYQDALVEFDLGHWAEARKMFLAIEKTSAYQKIARPKIEECTTVLLTFHMREFKGFTNGRHWKKAHKHLRAYMDLDPCDRKVFNRWVKKVEKAMRSRRFPTRFKPIPFECDRVVDMAVDLDPETEIKKRYPRAKISNALMKYFGGKIENAIHDLQRIKALSRRPKLVQQARELDNMLRVVKGKYNQGITYLMRGRYKEARKQLEIALDTDAKFIPDGLISFYREDIGKQLAGNLNREAADLFARYKYFRAFKKWKDCLKFSPDEGACETGMIKLEEVARDAIKQAQRFIDQGRKGKAAAVLEDVKRITRPASLPYKEAMLKKQKMDM